MGQTDRIRRRYDRLGRDYDRWTGLLRLAGFRDRHYRRLAVEALALRPGGHVVDIGCGTGRNLAMLHDAVGDQGRIICLDLSAGMLDATRARAKRLGIAAEFVHMDAADLDWPHGLDGILATFTLSLQPRYHDVIRSGLWALRPGGRFGVADMRIPWGLRTLSAPFTRPFGHDRRSLRRRPDKVLSQLAPTRRRPVFAGMAYVAYAIKEEA